MLLPALAHAQASVFRGSLPDADAVNVARTVTEIADDLIPKDQVRRSRLSSASRSSSSAPKTSWMAPLADLFVARRAGGMDWPSISGAALASDVIRTIQEDSIGVLVIVTLASGGVSHTRYLSKRVRSIFLASKSYWRNGAIQAKPN